ncbi:MmcQ/YjbR family DNA-binding protein [Riemerella columbina]|uniref:MmcQ/YjbR family DNA-binding protein n=1 Tax=Riemerella columbina TaxID=103810 RepID=UPI00266FC991|nr:MmcQ/YjbR family DNA-binding protein [Riemerella columbina]WKS96058.1 MmcQ/YjbR family DNA-binding protein [Riemerella columbina]
MNIEDIRTYALAKAGVTEGFPFGDDILVFKVQGKVFLLAFLSTYPLKINLKTNPEWSEELRAEYSAIYPAYHMNKKHWNTVEAEDLPNALVRELIDHSYQEVVKKLTKKQQQHLHSQNGE